MAIFLYGAKLSESLTLVTQLQAMQVEQEEMAHVHEVRRDSPAKDVDVSRDVETESTESSEFGEKNANSYIGMLSSLIWSNTVERKPSYCAGVDSWVPSNPEQIAEIPERLVINYKKIYPLMGDDLDKNGSFAVISDAEAQINFEKFGQETEAKGDGLERTEEDSLSEPTLDQIMREPPKPPLHHLIITFWKGPTEKHVLSLYRSRRVTDVIALCERCRECRDLFRLNPKDMKKEIYINELLIALKRNLYWKSQHIAASLGLLEYFKPASRRIRESLHVFCQPEGMTPLLISVQLNHVELVEYLLTLSPDLTVMDVNKNNILHLASSSSEEMINLLMSTQKCFEILNVPNIDGSSPLYLAVARANAYCAKAFRAHNASFSAVPTPSSQNPLMDLMKKNRFDLTQMKKILDNNPKALEEKDQLTGNGVLHNAMYKKPLSALLQLKKEDIELDARNSQMQTPLHIFVQRNDLSMLMVICAYGADINAKDNNGNTALHLSVSKNNLDIVRLLLCLGADPNIVNKHSESPRHLAAKMKDNETAREIIRSLIICKAKCCEKGFLGCTVACVHKDNCITEPKLPKMNSTKSLKEDEDEVSRTSVDPQAPTAMYEFELDPDSHDVDPAYKEPNPIRSFPQQGAIRDTLEKLKQFAEKGEDSNIISVLALDGGGIKGLVIVQILLALQSYLDKPLLSYFDWIAGTSTGSYVAGGACNGTSLRTMQKLYLRFKQALFDTWTRPYSAETLEGFLKEMFGENTKLTEIKYPRVFFTTVRANTFPVQMELLRNYRLPVSDEENNEVGFEDPDGLELWRAARRSSAAPTYFPSSEGKYIDGGMVSNNPTLDLLSEISFWNSVCSYVNSPHKVQVGCVVSVGTGVTPVSPVDPSLFEMNDMFGMLRGLKNLSLMVLDQATATEGAPIARSRSWCHSLGIPYFRLNAPLFKDIMLDSNEDPDLVKMMWDVVVYSYTHHKDFEDLAELLKAIGTNRNRKKKALSMQIPERKST